MADHPHIELDEILATCAILDIPVQKIRLLYGVVLLHLRDFPSSVDDLNFIHYQLHAIGVEHVAIQLTSES